jgi:hypothetical protein
VVRCPLRPGAGVTSCRGSLLDPAIVTRPAQHRWRPSCGLDLKLRDARFAAEDGPVWGCHVAFSLTSLQSPAPGIAGSRACLP